MTRWTRHGRAPFDLLDNKCTTCKNRLSCPVGMATGDESGAGSGGGARGWGCCWRWPPRWPWCRAAPPSGGGRVGARLARMERSPQWRDGQFMNPQPLRNDYWGMVRGAWQASEQGRPEQPLPIARRRRRPLCQRPGQRPARDLAGALDRAARDRRPPRADRPGLERPRLAARAGSGPGAGTRRRSPLAAAAGDRRRGHLARSLRPPGPPPPSGPWPPGTRTRSSSSRWASGPTSRTGACPRRASSSSTGGSARACADLDDRLHPRPPRLRPDAARQRREALGRLRAPGQRAPRLLLRRHRVCSRRCARSAPGWGRSISR